jgi:hypothetical protein
VYTAEPIIVTAVAPTLSYCVVNTNGREYLLACLAAIERTHPAGVERDPRTLAVIPFYRSSQIGLSISNGEI